MRTTGGANTGRTRTGGTTTGWSRIRWLVPLCALLAGCSVWQGGDISPDVVNGQVHRGSEAIAFDARSSTLASGGWEGELALWRVGEEEPYRIWEAHDSYVQGVAFLGEQILSAGYGGSLRLWNGPEALEREVDTGRGIFRIAVTGDRVVAGHTDGTVSVWTLPGLTALETHQVHDGSVLALVADAGTGRIASAGDDGLVYVIEAGEEPRRLPAPPSLVRSLEFSPDGATLYGGGWRRLVRWSVDGGAIDSVETPHWGYIAGLQYLPPERSMASISRVNDSSVYFLDPETGAPLRHFYRQSICGSAIRVSPDGRYLAATGDDGIIRMWDLSTPPTPPPYDAVSEQVG